MVADSVKMQDLRNKELETTRKYLHDRDESIEALETCLGEERRKVSCLQGDLREANDGSQNAKRTSQQLQIRYVKVSFFGSRLQTIARVARLLYKH